MALGAIYSFWCVGREMSFFNVRYIIKLKPQATTNHWPLFGCKKSLPIPKKVNPYISLILGKSGWWREGGGGRGFGEGEGFGYIVKEKYLPRLKNRTSDTYKSNTQMQTYSNINNALTSTPKYTIF